MSNVDVNYAMFNLGTGELVLIFLVILLLFGAKRLPELARGLGKESMNSRMLLKQAKKKLWMLRKVQRHP